MTFKPRAICVAVALSLGLFASHTPKALAQATQVPQAKVCFQATTGINGFVGLLGTITGGSGGISATTTYGGVPLTGGSGTGATANIVVSGGRVTSVSVLNPGQNYVIGDVLSATTIGVSGFSVPVASIAINSSLAGGTVGMYVPGTLSTKQTWQNANQTILNTNPVALDSNGCALIYGIGTYRQILFDSLGNEVWDQPTSVAPVSPYFAGLAQGTANAITLTDSSFSYTDGQQITFFASATNTGATTITPYIGATTISVVANSSAGPVPLTGGEIAAGNAENVVYSAANNDFVLQTSTKTTYPAIDVIAYGAVGDGITINNTALQAASNAAASSAGGLVRFPCGVFKITTQIIQNIASNAAVIWQGAGNCTYIYAASTNAVAFNWGNQFSSGSIYNMTFETDALGTYSGVSWSELGGQSTPAGPINYLVGVEFRGLDFTTAQTQYWGTAFSTIGPSNINVVGGLCNGAHTQIAGTCYYASGNPAATGPGQFPYGGIMNFSGTSMNNCNVGFHYGNWLQGITMTGGNMTDCNYGVQSDTCLDSPSDEPDQLNVTASQFNTFIYSFDIECQRFTNLILVGNSFITSGGDAIKLQGLGYIINDNTAGDATTASGNFVTIAGSIASGGLLKDNNAGLYKYMLYVQPNIDAQISATENNFSQAPLVFGSPVTVTATASGGNVTGLSLSSTSGGLYQFAPTLLIQGNGCTGATGTLTSSLQTVSGHTGWQVSAVTLTGVGASCAGAPTAAVQGSEKFYVDPTSIGVNIGDSQPMFFQDLPLCSTSFSVSGTVTGSRMLVLDARPESFNASIFGGSNGVNNALCDGPNWLGH